MRLATRFTTNVARAIVWEDCACLSCGNHRQSPVLESSDLVSGLRFLIVCCDDCGLAFTNPRPDAFSVAQFYPADYRCHQGKAPGEKLDPWNRHLPIAGLARLLDFGCGGGDFLLRMQAVGWSAVGLDASLAAVRKTRERGLIAHLGTLPHSALEGDCFDAITMRQSLEHVHRPLEVLCAARRMLTINGKLVVSVPNFAGLASHWFGADWYGLDLPRHLTHFTPATLRSMLMRAGFAQIELFQESHASWIRHTARREHRHKWARILRTRFGSSLASNWARMCGAAEAIIAVAKKTTDEHG